METNHNEVWPYNLLCRLYDPDELQELKADPPVELAAFLTYVIRDIYDATEVDLILMHYMAKIPMEMIVNVTQLPEEQITDILDGVGARLRDPILLETFRKGLRWRVETEKQKAYLEGYRRGYLYSSMKSEEMPTNEGCGFTDWLFDLPGHDHPIEYLDAPEEVYVQLYGAGIRKLSQLLEADDKKLIIDYRLEPEFINEIAGVLDDRGFSCPITMGRKPHTLSTPEGKLLIASLSETTAHHLRYYMPADMMQSFLFVKQIALDYNEIALLALYYDMDVSYQQIAEDMGMETCEVRAIAAKALRKLRAPDFYNLIRFGLKDTVRQMIRMESECGFQDGFNRGVDDRNQGDGEAVLPDDVMEKLRMIPIDNLELSYKTCFRLRRNNMETVADVVLAKDQDLLAINGFGRAVLKQLRRKQKQFIRDLRADMAAEEIASIFESDPTETVDEQE